MSAYAGYDWQFAPGWIAGFEADFGWANNRSTANPAPGLNSIQVGTPFTNLPIAMVSERWGGSVRSRLGMLITPDALLYGTAGLATQCVQLSASCTTTGNAYCTLNHDESVSRAMTGWTVGWGLEYRLWGNWLTRIEYRFADFGTFDHTFFRPAQVVAPFADDRFTAHVAVRTHVANVGLAYRF
jgi:outer membrane immunogenic protein